MLCLLCSWEPCLIFFFKQKTAYEMRISDWSSDVCSSDLVARADCHHHHFAGNAFFAQAQRFFQGDVIEWVGRQLDAIGDHAAEIGRASCRERVCQYG